MLGTGTFIWKGRNGIRIRKLAHGSNPVERAGTGAVKRSP